MRVLIIGNFVPEKIDFIKNMSLAGNKFQSNIINSIKKEHECDIISFIAYKTNPYEYKKVESFSNNHNYFFSKGNNTILNIIKFRKTIKRRINSYDLVITYNLAYPWLFITKFCKKIKTFLFLTDYSDTNSYNNLLLKLYAYICKKDIKKYDYVCGLSSKTQRYLKKGQKFICCHGGINFDLFNESKLVSKKGTFKFMYSGSSGAAAGSDLLIEAFNKFSSDANVELIITGKFDQEKISNPKIKIMGVLSYDEYIKCLDSCNVLVNPRNMNLPENNNNFPSKIFDYLLTGKVVLSTRFSDYEDFKDNFIFCDSTPEALYDSMISIIQNYDSYYKKYYNKNISYSKSFDWDLQIQKIFNALNDDN